MTKDNLLPPALFPLTSEGKKLEKAIAAQCMNMVVSDHDIKDFSQRLKSSYLQGHPIVAICSVGIIVRILAPFIQNKWIDPPVFALSEDGKTLIPILGWHHGGRLIANQLIEAINCSLVTTGASEGKFSFTLDDLPEGYIAPDPEKWKNIASRLFEGEYIIPFEGDKFLRDAGYPFSQEGSIKICLSVDEKPTDDYDFIVYQPRYAIGMGCERGADFEEVENLFLHCLEQKNLSPSHVKSIASIDVKADEFALHKLSEKYQIALMFFSADALNAQKDRLANPSDIVFKEVGCYGVAEGAALAIGGEESKLCLEKQKSKRATCAIAKLTEKTVTQPLSGRKRGLLRLVSLGPGKDAWRTPEATEHLLQADVIIGYSLYLDIVSHIIKDKEQISYPLGDEEIRVRDALNIAGDGKDVALICSGDAGIYAMGSLLHELLDTGRGLTDGAMRTEIVMSPGITAMQGAAAQIGSVLGHDFCAISLSDLLTPLEDIHKRIKAAAMGDFVTAFYNPVSKRRRTQLAYAKEILLQHRPANTPVILGRNLGRDTEELVIISLENLQVDDVDMLTTVIIGSSKSKAYSRGDGNSYVYTPRGYDKKDIA